MSDYGGLPRNAAVDSVASNYASDARISPEVERILRQTATVTSNTPALSPTRPPATLLAQGPPSPSGASRQAQPILPRPSSTNSLGSGSVLSVAVPGTAPSATPLPPLSSGQMSPTGGKKESRRTVLSHDEEVPEWDFFSSFNFVTLGLFGSETKMPNKVQQAASGAYWVVAGSLDSTIRTWVVQYDGQLGDTTTMHLNTPILSVCLLHPGVIGCGTPSGDIKVVQPQGEMTFAALSGHTAPVTGLTKLTAARVASCSNDGTLRIFLTRVGVCETTIELQPHQAPRCIAGMPSGQIVAGCEDGCVRVYAPGSAESIWTFKGHDGAVLSVASLDEVRTVSGGEDGTVRLWRVTQVDAERSLTGHNCPVTAVSAVSLARLASGGEDGSIRLWRGSDGACLRVFSGHTGAITALVVTPDASRLCSASRDGTCRLWRENGPPDEEPVVLEGHTDSVTSLTVGMQWDSMAPNDRFSEKRGCGRLC